MKKNIFYPFINFYHKTLSLFFDFDLHVYAHHMGKIKTSKLENFQSMRIFVKEKPVDDIQVNVVKLKKQATLMHNLPSLSSLLVIKDEKLNYQCVKRNYNLNFLNELKSIKEELDFEISINNEQQIHIERKVKIIEELLELEPYTNKAIIKAIRKIPVVKYPVKKEKFNELQLNKMRTQLAMEAKCKVYSMSLENIYTKIPKGLYSEISLEKNNSLKCYLEENPHIGDLQLLVTGKRKYDTQTTKTLISYSDLGIDL